MQKYHREVAKRLKREGFKDIAYINRGSHMRLVATYQGHQVMTHVPVSPSDQRGIKNIIADMRREARNRANG